MTSVTSLVRPSTLTTTTSISTKGTSPLSLQLCISVATHLLAVNKMLLRYVSLTVNKAVKRYLRLLIFYHFSLKGISYHKDVF